MTIKDWYSRNGLRFELVLGLATGPIVWFLSAPPFFGHGLLEQVPELYLTLAQIETTLLGFILLTLGVVFTQLNQPRLATVRTHPSFNELWRIFVSTIKILGAGVIIALISIVSSSLSFPLSFEIMAVLNVSIAAAALLRVARCVWVLETVIKASLEQ